MKKRKQFDSSKQRLQGTEIESFVLQTVPKTSRKKEAQLNLSKSKWKEKVERVRAMQAVKKPAETPLASQVVKPSDHEECPYCGRSFGPKAYERHTEFCKEQIHKLKVSNNTNSEARERLKVRTTYRGPLTNKVLNRDRYQPNRNRDPSPLGLSSSEIYDDTPKSRGLSRNSSLRSSLRSKPDTTPPPPLRRTMTQINSPSRGPRVSPKDTNESDLLQKNQSFSNKPRMISKEPIEKRDAEKYNPYISAERQMLELFGTDDGKGKTSLPEIHHSSPIQSSPISAFVKYSSPKRASSIESLKSDNKENNNLNPDVTDFPPVENKIDNRKNFSLSNLSLCSVVSIDSIDCNKNSFNSKLTDSHLDDFQRSFSAIEPKSNRTVVKPKVNLQQMLYGSHTISPGETSQRESNNSDTENLEACEAELLISMLEFEKMLKSSPPSSPETSPNLCSSSSRKEKETDEDVENRNHKFLNNSIDSAYSSLTRSSGAEGDSGKVEMSKFCHECGAKYPIAGAKFCCNCGMRRITL